jgi:ubiquinol-cytochrome c reductase cytochrome b subunit
VRKLLDWLDTRIGAREMWRRFAEHPVAGGARWAYVFGSVLLALFALQALTGIALATVYSPSPNGAWASVAYLEREVTLGWLLRRLHQGTASAIVVLCGLHIAQVVWFGAYKKPREVNWWLGLALLGCVLGFGLTGYLLPWDQKGYFATQVATHLAGPWLGRLLTGGAEYGALTLTRFYAFHVLVLPAVTLLLVVGHVALMLRHGVTPAARLPAPPTMIPSAEPFWPRQALRDLAAMTAAAGLVLAWAIWRRNGGGEPVLEAPADPGAGYEARPEWYFLPLFQLLKMLPGSWERAAAFGLPVLLVLLLGGLPFLDRAPSTAWRARQLPIALVAMLGLAAIGLGARAWIADARDANFQRGRERARHRAARALELAKGGVPSVSANAVWLNDPLERGRRVFADRCAGCHIFDGAGERKGPDLDGWSSRAWLRALLLEPDAKRFYGATKVRGMKPVKVEGAELDALVEWIWAQGESKVAGQSPDKFGCDDCHELDGKTGSDGPPNLGGRGSKEWLRAFLLAPGDERFFGRKNDMPAVGTKLTPEELDAVVELISAERSRP